MVVTIWVCAGKLGADSVQVAPDESVIVVVLAGTATLVNGRLRVTEGHAACAALAIDRHATRIRGNCFNCSFLRANEEAGTEGWKTVFGP